MMRLLALIPLALAMRTERRGVSLETQEQVQCEITTEYGATVTFPVNKCNIECVMATGWDGVATSQQNKQFSSSFDVEYVESKDKCVCKVKGEPRIQYKPMCRNGLVCKDACMENSKDAKEQCWASYKRLAAMDAVEVGDLTVFRQGQRFAYDSDFKLVQSCLPCPADGVCGDATIPPVTEYLTGKMKSTLHQQIEEAKAANKLTGPLEDFDDMLTESDKGNLAYLAWSIHDTNNDGQVSSEELEKVYPNVLKSRIAEIVAKVGTGGNVQVNEAEFERFQEIIFSKWTFKEDGQSAILACVNSQTDQIGVCLGTLKGEIAKATNCIN